MRTVPLEFRYNGIIEVLTLATEPLGPREIAHQYLTEVTPSDVLTTGSILNVLSLAGIVSKTSTFKGKSVKNTYALARRPNG